MCVGLLADELPKVWMAEDRRCTVSVYRALCERQLVLEEVDARGQACEDGVVASSGSVVHLCDGSACHSYSLHSRASSGGGLYARHGAKACLFLPLFPYPQVQA